MTLSAQAKQAFLAYYEATFNTRTISAEHRQEALDNMTSDRILEALATGLPVLMTAAALGIDLETLLDELFLLIQLNPTGQTDEAFQAVLANHVDGVR